MAAETGDHGDYDATVVPDEYQVFPLEDVEPCISIRNLNHYFGDGEAREQKIFDVNLDVYPGEIVIITGPSGCGKSTLLTLIGALRSVQEGHITVLGRELYGLKENEMVAARRDIGFIFQAHNLLSSLTSVQNVVMGMQLKSSSAAQMRATAQQRLQDLLLPDEAFVKTSSALSGGMRQRVAIARALASEPKLILADEPTAALDKHSGAEVIKQFKKLRDQHEASILIVTHDNRILDAADRIVAMSEGRIVSNVRVDESVALCLFLSRVPGFEKHSVEDLTEIVAKMTKEIYDHNEVIIVENEPGDKFYIIRHGLVQILPGKIDQIKEFIVPIDAKPGERQLLQNETVKGILEDSPIIMSEGDYFGEGALLKKSKLRNATVVAKNRVMVYSLDREDFEATLAASGDLRNQIYKVYLQRQ